MGNKTVDLIGRGIAILAMAVMYSWCDAGEKDIVGLLDATDCAWVDDERPFLMSILGRSFPLPAGFEFRGLDRGHARFELRASGDIAGRALVYYSSGSEGRYFGDGPPEFQLIRWKNFHFLYKVSEGGRTARLKSYQALMRSGDDELIITAGAPQMIANILGCSE